jgi:DNA-binding transcriptional ArsR family regulator
VTALPVGALFMTAAIFLVVFDVDVFCELPPLNSVEALLNLNNPMPEEAPAAPPTPIISLEDTLSAIANPTRWWILAELAGGDQLMVAEIAERTRQSAAAISKHMAVLRQAGVVVQGRNRLYQLDPRFIADKSQRLIDLGWCLLRMSAAAR